jgi:hypothetical protein
VAKWYWLLAGMASGAVHIYWLGKIISSIGQPAKSPWIGLYWSIGLRLALIGGVFLFAAMSGFTQLLFALGGYWLIRWPILAVLSSHHTHGRVDGIEQGLDHKERELA